MKYILFNIIAIFYFSCFVSAKDLQNVRNVHIQGGTVNGGLHTATGIEKYFGENLTNSIFLNINYQYLIRPIETVDITLREQNIFLNIGYRKYFPISHKVSPYAGISLIGGLQHQGYSKSNIYEHIPKKDLLYGAGTHAGIEYKLSRFSFFLEGAYLFEYDHSWILSIGIKHFF